MSHGRRGLQPAAAVWLDNMNIDEQLWLTRAVHQYSCYPARQQQQAVAQHPTPGPNCFTPPVYLIILL